MQAQAQHPAEARSVTELCDLVLTANESGDDGLLNETIGMIGLLLGTITRQAKDDILRAALREIAHTCSVPDTRKILKAAELGLTTEQADWLTTQLREIAAGKLSE